MPSFTSPTDSTQLFFQYYVPGQHASKPQEPGAPALTLVFLHGWPMSSRVWDHLMVPLCEDSRFRCVAPDRRGFGTSDWNSPQTETVLTWKIFIGDLVGILKYLDVGDIVFVAASMGCAESLHAYQSSEFVRARCKGFVWMGPNMSYPLQSPEHPLSPSAELWESILDGLRERRAEFVDKSLPGVFAVHAGNYVSPKTLEQFERIVAEANSLALKKTVAVIQQSTASELEALAKDAKRIPVMLLHGDADQGMPLEASSVRIKEIVPWAELNVYQNAGHGLYLTHAHQVLVDLKCFLGKLTTR